MSTEFYKNQDMGEKDDSIYRKAETAKYRDTVLNEQNGAWSNKEGLKITAEKGKIVVTSKAEDNSRTIVKRFEPSAKMESFDMQDSKAKIDVKVNVSEEEKSLKEFMKQLEDKVGEPVYGGHNMKQEQGAWVFREAGKGWVIIDLIKDDRETGAVVVESSIHKSVERVDTKKFNLNNELFSFDSATEHGDMPRIKVRPGVYERDDEQTRIDEFLSKPNVKLRAQAYEQQESQKLADILNSGFLMK